MFQSLPVDPIGIRVGDVSARQQVIEVAAEAAVNASSGLGSARVVYDE